MSRAFDISANDNEPLDRFPRGDAAGFRALLMDRKRQFTQANSDSFAMHLTSQARKSDLGLILALLCWGAAATALIWSFYTGQSIGARIFSSIALIWTGLWAAYTAQDYDMPRLSEMAVLTSLIGFLGTLLPATTQLGLPLQTSGGLGLFSLTTLLVSGLTKSKIALMASICACLCWAGLHLDGYLAPSFIVLAIPLILIGQIIVGGWLGSHISMFGAVITGYVWISGFAVAQHLAGNLSPLYLVGALFVISIAHCRSAKAAEDAGVNSMPLHIVFAWFLGSVCLLAIQHYLLYPDYEIWTNGPRTKPLLRFGWVGLCALALVILFLSGLVRYRFGKMTFASVITMTLVTALVPILIWFEPHLFAANAAPLDDGQIFLLLGMCLGGIIFTSAFLFTLNNMRRGRAILGIFGLAVIGVNADMAFEPQFWNYDTGLAWFIGALVCAGTVIFLASAQFDPNAPQRSLQTLKEV
jgi:hypothetical protein